MIGMMMMIMIDAYDWIELTIWIHFVHDSWLLVPLTCPMVHALSPSGVERRVEESKGGNGERRESE